MLSKEKYNSNCGRKTTKMGERAVVKTMMLSLVLVLGVAGAITASPTGKLLMRIYNDRDWDLYMMNEDGTNLQAVDITSSNVDQGVFSPDGRMILYSVETTSGSRSIFHVSVDGGTPELVPGVSGQFGHGLCWGDESGHFYYDEVVHYSCGASTYALHKRDLDGSYDEVVMTSHSSLWDVLEALNKIVCKENVPLGCYSGYGAIVTYNGDGSNRYVLPATVDYKSDEYPTISPDGEWILYIKSDSGWADPHNVYRIRWDGTEQQRLTNYAGCTTHPIWRDNDTIFYSETPNMWTVDYKLHRYTISNNEDVEIPCSLPSPVPLDFLMINGPTLVAIDIKPNSCPNPLNVKNQGVLPVAILGSKDYDVFDIDPASLRLEDIAPIRSSYEDVATLVPGEAGECACTAEGPDGYLDLVLKFETQEIVAALGAVYDGDVLPLILTGVDVDETPIEGADCVVVIAKK